MSSTTEDSAEDERLRKRRRMPGIQEELETLKNDLAERHRREQVNYALALEELDEAQSQIEALETEVRTLHTGAFDALEQRIGRLEEKQNEMLLLLRDATAMLHETMTLLRTVY